MSWFTSHFVPAFPPHSGPFKVGSVDVELPISELDSPTPAPVDDIGTVAFRIFYPSTTSSDASSARPVRWIPSPQTEYCRSFVEFLGGNKTTSRVLATLSHTFYYINLPVIRNAGLAEPQTTNSRWPVLFFSHGLGGSRNLYSYLCGSIASHGVVVIAPDHRDGSGHLSFVRKSDHSEARVVNYQVVRHEETQEILEKRDRQLRIRLWELGLIHDAVLRIDNGEKFSNLDPNFADTKQKQPTEVLGMFKGQLDVHRPNSITWAGHSFGGSSMMQLVKSTYWRQLATEDKNYKPLFVPSPDSSIVKQITPQSTVVVYDPWMMPLLSNDTKALFNKPLPCYDSSGPGGSALLAILSEGFINWKSHFEKTMRTLSEDPRENVAKITKQPPRIFYPTNSSHLAQSDAGILFPWVIRKFAKSDESERQLRLNTRATLQIMRDNGHEVSDTSFVDREETDDDSKRSDSVTSQNLGQDWKILSPSGNVRGWKHLAVDKKEGVKSLKEDNDPVQVMIEEGVNDRSAIHKT